MKRSGQFLIPSTIIVGFVLQIMPMPALIDMYRPNWLFLILCYWSMALPNRVGVGVSALCGITLDVLYGSALGVNSFAMAIPVYLVVANYQRLRNYSLVQQSIMILVLGALYHMLVYWLQYVLTGIEFRISYLFPVLTSILIWPWLFWLLRKLRRAFRVN